MQFKSTLQAFQVSPFFSIKHTNYFDIYDKLLSKYIGEKITFVEVGILDGGSLFMWREFFGESTRIIGVDLNPHAIKWREHGFEIFVGNQSDPKFWANFFSEVGEIDVLLDDGGHRNDQQIITVNSSLPHVRDGGLIIIEDTQTSFMKFESFKYFTFVSFLKRKIRSLYSRSDELQIEGDLFSKSVHSLEFFTGICVLHVHRTLCSPAHRIENMGEKSYQSDFRYSTDNYLSGSLRSAYDWISWDYLSVQRIQKYPRISKIVQVKLIRNISRLFIIPIRFFIYFLLKILNLYHLQKHL